MSNDSENPESKYEVREVIGKGAFGEVNLVVERQSKQRFVLKRIKMARQSEWQRRATRQEIEIVSRLRHPFVMPYKEHWIHHGHTINVVYGYCEKGDLTSAITKQRGKLFPEHTLRLWLAELLLAVDYMHRQNVLHRDIKTQNILLTGDGDVQIGDFGLSTVRVPSGETAQIPSCDDTDSRMDMSPPHADHHACVDQFAVHMNVQNGHHPHMQLGPGECKAKDPVQGHTPVHDAKAGTRNDYALVGTPHFMSPELLSSQKYSYETDIWSLGVVMYELTTLKPPFNAFNLAGLVAKIKRAALPPIPTSYSADWVSILKSMLRKDPTRRANPLELLAIPSMQQALQQAHQRATAMSPEYVLPEIPLPESGVSPGFCFAPSMGSGGGAAAAHRTPSAGEAAVTPLLVHPPISGGGDADFGTDMETDASPVSAFPNLASAATESPLPSRPAEARAAPAPSGSMTARVTSSAATAAAAETGRSKTPSVPRRTNSGAVSSAAKQPVSQPVAKRPVSPTARSATARLAPAAPPEAGPIRSKTPGRTAAAAKADEPVPTGRLFRKASLPREARSHTPGPKVHVPASPREKSSAADTTGRPASPAGTTPALDRQLSHRGGVASGTTARTMRTGSAKRSVLDTVGGTEARSAGTAPLAMSPIVLSSPRGETESDVATPDALNTTVDSRGFSPSTGGDSLHKSPLVPGPSSGGSAAAGSSRVREAAPWRSASAARTTRNALATISSPPPMPTRRAAVAAATTVDGSHTVGASKRSSGTTDDNSTSSKRASSSGTGTQPESILHAPATARARVTASPVRSSHTTVPVRRGSQPGAAQGREPAKEAPDGFMSARQPRVRRASYTSYDKPSVAQQPAPQLRRQQSAAGDVGVTTTKDVGKKTSSGGGGAAASPARVVSSTAPVAPKLESSLVVIPSDSAEGSPAGNNSPIAMPQPNTLAGSTSPGAGCGPSGANAQSEPQAHVPGLVGPAVPSPSPGAATAQQASSPATSGHPWRAAPRSRSMLSVTTEDSDLSIPDGRYLSSEGDTGGRVFEADVVTAAAAMSTAGPANVSNTGAGPFWSSNQLFSGNYSSFGAALAAEAVGTAVTDAATVVAVSGASEPTAPAAQQPDAAPALSADLPRRVSASAFAPHLQHGDVTTDGAAGEARDGSMSSDTDSASSSSPETQPDFCNDAPLSPSGDVTMASATNSPSASPSVSPPQYIHSSGSQPRQSRRTSTGRPTDTSRLSNASQGLDSNGPDFTGATEGTSRSSSSSSATGADINSPLHTVAEDEAGEAESSATCSDAPVPFSSEQISLGLWGSEREQLIRLQRVVALSASLWEAGRDTELGAVLSSTLTRPLVRRVRTDPVAASKATAYGVQQRTQQRLADPGDVVYVSSGPLRGVQAVVRYRGTCHWGAGTVLGLELSPNTPIAGEAGSTDDLGVGARDGVTYFRCQQPNHRAVFVPLEHAVLQ